MSSGVGTGLDLFRHLTYRSTLHSMGFSAGLSQILETLQAFSHQDPSFKPPCILHIELPFEYSDIAAGTVLEQSIHRGLQKVGDFAAIDAEFERLGYLSLIFVEKMSEEFPSHTITHAYGILVQDCPRYRLDRVRHFIHSQVTDYLQSKIHKYELSAGSTMKCGRHGKEFHAIDETLPSDVSCFISFVYDALILVLLYFLIGFIWHRF